MLSLSLMLPLMQQASGINTVIYYSSMVRGGRASAPQGGEARMQRSADHGGMQWAANPASALARPTPASPPHTLANTPRCQIHATSAQVFLKAGLKSPIVGSILVGAINLGFTAGAATLMDRWGRKPLLQASFAGMAASLAAVAAAIFLPSERPLAASRAALGGWRRGGRCGRALARRPDALRGCAVPLVQPQLPAHLAKTLPLTAVLAAASSAPARSRAARAGRADGSAHAALRRSVCSGWVAAFCHHAPPQGTEARRRPRSCSAVPRAPDTRVRAFFIAAPSQNTRAAARPS